MWVRETEARAPLSQTAMRPALGLAPPEVASVIVICREPVLACVARSALSTSSDSAYGSGARPCGEVPLSVTAGVWPQVGVAWGACLG